VIPALVVALHSRGAFLAPTHSCSLSFLLLNPAYTCSFCECDSQGRKNEENHIDALAMVLSGCATTVPMPKEDTLDYLRVTENNITVMSDKYGYVFKRDKTRDVYNDYKAFMTSSGIKAPVWRCTLW
jgi:hypothetical protein